jgi:beta-galactosidase GanA
MMALTNIFRGRVSDLLGLIFLAVSATQAADLPHFRAENGAEQLLVHGKPFLIRGGELGNSSAGTPAQADAILPAMARLHVNTILMPVAWEQVEPKEGDFDFSILDHWIDIARQQHLHLVLLWFGAWKNAFSEYAPDWVKADTKRFPRAQSAHGVTTEILSTFGTETVRADSRAFRSVMAHLREKDQEQQTVLMVQVENEMGYLGQGRDRSPEADRQFNGPVPQGSLADLRPDGRSFRRNWRLISIRKAAPGPKCSAMPLAKPSWPGDTRYS